MPRAARLALAALLLTLLVQAPARAVPSTTAEPGFVTNGEVHKVVRTPDRTFLGGDFDYIGPPTGGAAVLSSGGALDTSYPQVNGVVKTSVQDGAGGFFVGGEFTRVGDAERDSLAHILQDGTVDPDFDPDFTFNNQDGIRSISRNGTKLYVAGSFTHVDGTQRNGVALLDTTDGSLDSDFAPVVGGVNVILAQSSRVYLGGTFTTVNSVTRKRVAAVNPTDGSTLTAFTADVDSDETLKSVDALLIKGTKLYVAGHFGTVNGTDRPGAAAVDATTGALDTTFAPLLFDFQEYEALAADSTHLFVADRDRVQSLDLTTGAPASGFAVSVGGVEFPDTTSLLVNGSTLLVGGRFTRVNGTPRLRFAAVSTTTGEVSNSTVQTFSHPPLTMTPPDSFHGGKLFVGGEFTSAGGVERRGLAALDSSGDVDPAFENNAFGDGFDEPAEIDAMAFGDGRVYVGGNIRDVGGEDGSGVFALDPATGDIDPGFDGDAGFGQIEDLEFRDGRLYVAGSFAQISGEPRDDLAALDPATGAPDPGFTPEPGHASGFTTVADIAIAGQRMYVAGRFDTIGGLNRPFVAALDLDSGDVDPDFQISLESNQSEPLRSLATDGTRVYFGGFFTTVNGFPRANVAAVTADTGDTVVAWNPTVAGAVDDIAVGGDRVFLAGFFSDVDGATRRGFAAVSRSTGALDAWDPLVGSPFIAGDAAHGNSVAISNGRIDMGGLFTRVDGVARSGFVSVSTPMPVSSAPPIVSGEGRSGQVLECSPGSWSNSPAFAFEWLRDGRPIAGAAGPAYAVTDADAGRSVRCRVTASNSDGSAEATSAAVAIEELPVEQAPVEQAPGPGGDTQPVGGPPPSGAPGPSRRAKVRIAGSSVTLKRRVASVRLRCTNGAGDCSGKVTLRTPGRKHKKLGGKRFAIDAGDSLTVRIGLSRKARAKARRLKLVRVAAPGTSKTLSLLVRR